MPADSDQGRWVEDARRAASEVGSDIGVEADETWLTDRLIQFSFRPGNDAAATILLMASRDETIFCAGTGTRVELDAPSRSSGELRQLARAVASGRLVEVVGGRKVKFRLDLDDKVIAGTATWERSRGTGSGKREYAPYPPPPK